MKVFQLAKELGIDSKAIIAKTHDELAILNVNITTHMSEVPAKLEARIRIWFGAGVPTPEENGRNILALFAQHKCQVGSMLKLEDLLSEIQRPDLKQGLEWLAERGFIDTKGSIIGQYYLTSAGYKEL